MEKSYIINENGVVLNPDIEWDFRKEPERASIKYGRLENGKWDYSINIDLKDSGHHEPVSVGTWDTKEMCIAASHAAMIANFEKQINREGNKYPFLQKALDALKAHINDNKQFSLF